MHRLELNIFTPKPITLQKISHCVRKHEQKYSLQKRKKKKNFRNNLNVYQLENGKISGDIYIMKHDKVVKMNEVK